MQRPCFALAVLLGSIASSLVMVSTANSQSPVVAVIELPGPAASVGIIHEVAVTLVLGQSIDIGSDDWLAECEAPEQSHCSANYDCDYDCDYDCQVEPIVATTPTSNQPTGFWSTLMTTGYDIAYDYAMFGGRFLATEPCHQDHEKFVSVDVQEGFDCLQDVEEEVACPDEVATSIESEEYNYCLGWGCERIDSSYVAEVDEATPADTLEETNSSVPLLLPEDSSAWLWQGIENSGAFAGEELHKWWTLAQENAWTQGVRDQLLNWNSIPTNIGAISRKAPATPVSVETPNSFQQEMLMLIAADSLEIIGKQLQGAADQLRFLAADRIVSKSSARRVANKPTN
jgi:hypothetical protein